MNKYQNNKALLSQTEIDTLIRFLTNHKENVQDAILSQDSIDKVIQMLHKNNVRTVNYEDTSATEAEKIKAIDLTGYLLDAVVNEDTQFIELSAYDKNTDKRISITPLCVQKTHLVEDNSKWGFFIEPSSFNHIAEMFHIQYQQNTYDTICRIFAKHLFGDENAIIPAIYLPSSESLLDTLIL